MKSAQFAEEFFRHILAAVCCKLSVQSAGGRKVPEMVQS